MNAHILLDIVLACSNSTSPKLHAHLCRGIIHSPCSQLLRHGWDERLELLPASCVRRLLLLLGRGPNVGKWGSIGSLRRALEAHVACRGCSRRFWNVVRWVSGLRVVKWW